jgi:hypothetical protein
MEAAARRPVAKGDARVALRFSSSACEASMNTGEREKPLIILPDGRTRGHYYTELREMLDAEWVDDPFRKTERTPDLVIVSDEYSAVISPMIRDYGRRGIPTLLVADGIVEWRNTWENPRSLSPGEGMPLFQPILSDKVACLGRSQARVFESWGNLGKCEIVGAPRFDRLLGRSARKRPEGEPLRVLVMTARQPGFTPRQIELTLKSLLDLKTWFDRHDSAGDVRIVPVWRVTGDLPARIGLDTEPTEFTGRELAGILPEIDAVISTPSTVLLEGMLQGVPVAILDYTNSPHYVPAAWSITAAEHFDDVLHGLIHPSEARMLYQGTILHDSLEFRTPAAGRLLKLAESMIAIGRACRTENRPLSFPERILPDEQGGHHLPEGRFDMRKLYPEHAVFGRMDVVALQAEVGHLQAQSHKIEEQLHQARIECSSLAVKQEALEAELAECRQERQRYKVGLERLMNKPYVRVGRAIKRLFLGGAGGQQEKGSSENSKHA